MGVGGWECCDLLIFQVNFSELFFWSKVDGGAVMGVRLVYRDGRQRRGSLWLTLDRCITINALNQLGLDSFFCSIFQDF